MHLHMNITHMHVLIGTYTEPTHQGCGEGICLAQLDQTSGEVSLLSSYSGIPNPSYLALDSDSRIYAASETSPVGNVAALSLNNQKIEELWRVDAGGAATCHVAVHPFTQKVAIANYRSGSSKLLSAKDGQTLATWSYQGSGPNEKRQESAHAHQALFSPNGRWLLVTDLGSDRLWVHAIDKKPANQPAHSITFPAGAGPRHSIFHTNLPALYTITELDGKVYWGTWDETAGICEWKGQLSILGADDQTPPQSSAIKLHPRLPRLYAADRASGQIAVFSIDQQGGLQRYHSIAVTGKGPRDFALSPDGQWLLVACQESNEILSISLNTSNGLPSADPVKSPFGSPVCLVFAPESMSGST